jgi:hypothetical protein
VSYFTPANLTPYSAPLELDYPYRLRLALERDAKFNTEEQWVYDDTAIELEYGVGFLRRAHP